MTDDNAPIGLGPLEQRVWTFASDVCARHGTEVVNVEWIGQGRSGRLRVYIDTADRRVGLDRCEQVSRDLSLALDAADFIIGRYHLEVSSPGIDRPLRTRADFRRAVGRNVEIRLKTPLDGRRNFRGRLAAVTADAIVVHAPGAVTLPLALLQNAKQPFEGDLFAESERIMKERGLTPISVDAAAPAADADNDAGGADDAVHGGPPGPAERTAEPAAPAKAERGAKPDRPEKPNAAPRIDKSGRPYPARRADAPDPGAGRRTARDDRNRNAPARAERKGRR